MLLLDAAVVVKDAVVLQGTLLATIQVGTVQKDPKGEFLLHLFQVCMQPEDPTSPLSILKTFLTDELIDNIVEFTNVYAVIRINDPDIQAHMNNKRRSIFHLWRETNRDEMWMFV